ncbi:hypothetical protein [Halioglobus maricola]|nr:hypothetical protein [Halioglobus maricola]
MSLRALCFLTVFTPILVVSFAGAQNTDITEELISRMEQTRAVNLDEVVAALELERSPQSSPDNFAVPNPYQPHYMAIEDDPMQITLPGLAPAIHHQQSIYEWTRRINAGDANSKVCALRFTSERQQEYKLKTFNSSAEARESGYLVTHASHCGACSSLADLAAFLRVRDMTTPSRKCTRESEVEDMARCSEALGLSRPCAEVWAYNAEHTRTECRGICLSDYGFFRLLFGIEDKRTVDADGRLRPCIACDEAISGPAYKYAAGRTRRTSGVESAIPRSSEELYEVDFREYYQLFGLQAPEVK